MALISVIVDKVTGRRRGTTFSLHDSQPSDKTADFVIDATLTENHQFESKPTENPVEEGIQITDHIDLDPESLTITGVISNTPLNFSASVAGAATNTGALIGKQVLGPLGSLAGVGAGAVAGLLLSPDNRMKNSLESLRDLQVKRIPFSVITGLRKYKNMVLTSLTINRDTKTGQSFNFSATLKQIRYVQSKTIRVPNVFKNTVGAGAKAELGKQSTSVASADNKTISKSIFDHIRGK